MIFFAVAAPTPGSASNCAWVAWLRSTGPALDAGADAFAARGAAAAGVGADAPTVTMPAIACVVRADTPARPRSATDEYGRPAMIFFAVAAPIPGSASNCACVALLRSTGPLVAAREGVAAFVARLAAALAR